MMTLIKDSSQFNNFHTVNQFLNLDDNVQINRGVKTTANGNNGISYSKLCWNNFIKQSSTIVTFVFMQEFFTPKKGWVYVL